MKPESVEEVKTEEKDIQNEVGLEQIQLEEVKQETLEEKLKIVQEVFLNPLMKNVF